MSRTAITILLVEPDTNQRRLFRRTLALTDDVQQIIDTGDQEDGILLAQRHQPQIILLNARLADLNTIVRRIKSVLPDAQIIVYAVGQFSKLMGAASTVLPGEIAQLVQSGVNPNHIISIDGTNDLLSQVRTLTESLPKRDQTMLDKHPVSPPATTKELEEESGKPEDKSELATQELKSVKLPGGISDTQELEEVSGQEPEPIIELEEDSTDEQTVQKVRFSAFYPREVAAKSRYGLLVYAHLEDALDSIKHDAAKFEEDLGGEISAPKTAKQSIELAENIPVTITPESDELQFEPPMLTKTWRGDFTRFHFDFMPTQKNIGDTAVIRISVRVAGIEIAFIKCALDITEASNRPLPTLADWDNPLARARLETEPAEYYHKIFVSYSRKDTVVAAAYRLAQIAAGHDVFMDSYSIRSGENWQAALAIAIDEADIFQLFWSEHSAASENCRDEWEYALLHKCPEDRCVHFIRPVYWQKPLVSPPQELGHINFRFVPLGE